MLQALLHKLIMLTLHICLQALRPSKTISSVHSLAPTNKDSETNAIQLPGPAEPQFQLQWHQPKQDPQPAAGPKKAVPPHIAPPWPCMLLAGRLDLPGLAVLPLNLTRVEHPARLCQSRTGTVGSGVMQPVPKRRLLLKAFQNNWFPSKQSNRKVLCSHFSPSSVFIFVSLL